MSLTETMTIFDLREPLYGGTNGSSWLILQPCASPALRFISRLHGYRPHAPLLPPHADVYHQFIRPQNAPPSPSLPTTTSHSLTLFIVIVLTLISSPAFLMSPYYTCLVHPVCLVHE